MALPIIEDPIYGQMTLETAAWSSTFTWVDRTSDLVQGINYSQGGRVALPGQSQVDVGTLNATFKNVTTAPVVGDLVRLRRTGTTEYAWIGYVQDVSQRIVFDQSVSYTTPVTLTTINCVDWVGYISQFQAVGAGGLSAAFAVEDAYDFRSRARALNNIVDPTNATQIISVGVDGDSAIVGDTNLVGTLAQHLDLMVQTQNCVWYGRNVLPTNKTTGRTSLVRIISRSTSIPPAIGFTDAASASLNHYIEIDFESSSANIANTIVATNFSRIPPTYSEVTKIGGFNEQNFVVVNNAEVVGINFEKEWTVSDSTSITTYGNRQTQIDLNLAGIVEDVNLIGNPSMEYGDDGWSTGANRMARRKPAENVTPFVAADGEWALRYRLAASGLTPSYRYSGTENDGIPVIAGQSYMVQAQGMRGVPNRTDVRSRAYITWQDEAGANISTIYGAQTSNPGGYVWVTVTVAGTAPAGAERAVVGIEFNRSGGGSFTAGDQFWADAFMMRKSASATAVTYFDGDTNGSAASLYQWTGGVGLSPSFKVTNNIDNRIDALLARYATTSKRVTRIRWNAQENLARVSGLYVGVIVPITFGGVTTNHRIVGIDGNISPDRYIIDYYLEAF